MSSVRQRRFGFGLMALVVGVIPTVTACGAGQQAETKKEYFGEGSFWDLNQLKLRGFALVPVSDSTVQGSAYLQGVVYNETGSAQQITQLQLPSGGSFHAAVLNQPSASAAAGASQSASSGGLPITVPPGGHVVIGPDGDVRLIASNLPSSVREGFTTPLRVTASTGSASFPLPVVINSGTTAVSTSISATPVQYPAEHIDPRWSLPPYDDRNSEVNGGSPAPPPSPAGG